jgi:hypothetical protein
MKKITAALNTFVLFSSLSIFGCSDSVAPTKEPEPEPTDPLASLYGHYLLECFDFGGGPRNQLFAKLNTSGELETVVLTWTADNCEGTFTLSNFNGDPLVEPEHRQDFEYFEVDGIPENFYVLKITNTDDSGITYGVFNKAGTKMHALTDITTFPKTWEKALENADVEEFANNPATATPDTYGILHFNEGELPDQLEALYKTWLSDCADFGGGELIQPYAEFSADEVLSANVVWSDPGCTGTYDLYDLSSNMISEPEHLQDIKVHPVLGIPQYMFVVKVTTVGTSDVLYALIYVNETFDEFYELAAFESSPATWTEWLALPGVSDFTADPTTAVPGMGQIKLHFTNNPLPM